ncbi:hypothetical protein EII29_07195 [Leptotrichia sp. OH3620_COT-345]|uniref:hypothetical protein n=1 Tax=Leptotrichia sp. OH3620_COT-345 TaxID=2491048 RepID=UPI000F6538AE|nr:hypothetical protein [Leptotrichia sp. OH3620_COT-345]RRD39368.1 hypothetical protein EII29_07195 [Leptotrichia sp. OH3620_COT-345]
MKNERLIKIWGDIVSISELVISIIIVAITTFAGYFLSFGIQINVDPKAIQLLFGLAGTTAGFIITSLLFRPKRKLKTEGINDI